MNTEFLKQFDKDIDKLSLQSVKEDVIATIENIENAENLADIDNLKKLKGFKNA